MFFFPGSSSRSPRSWLSMIMRTRNSLGSARTYLTKAVITICDTGFERASLNHKNALQTTSSTMDVFLSWIFEPIALFITFNVHAHSELSGQRPYLLSSPGQQHFWSWASVSPSACVSTSTDAWWKWIDTSGDESRCEMQQVVFLEPTPKCPSQTFK